MRERTITEPEWAYVAGLVDGEGTIGIYEAGHQIFLKLIVSNTSEALISWLHERFGGSLAHHPARGRHKAGWQHVLYQHRAAEVIARCRPYLVVKAAQADLALEFIGTTTFKKARRLDEEERARRRSYTVRSHDLNRRGIGESVGAYVLEAVV